MRSISELTPEFLSQALGTLVTDAGSEQLKDGYMADVYRLRLKGAAVPDSIIAKLPAADSERRREAETFNSYGKESFFYRELAAQVPVRIPHCFYNPADHFCLLLEDMGNFDSRIDPAEALAALSSLHAARFPSHNLPAFDDALHAAAPGLASDGDAWLRERNPGIATDLLRAYCSASLSCRALFMEQEQVLSHMDFRPGNIGMTGEGFTIVDWGEFCLAPRGLDIAALLVAGDCLERESVLIDVYSKAAGVPVGKVMDSYRLALLPLLYLPVLIALQGDRQESERIAGCLLSAVTRHADYLASRVP